jgi:hypothetical protein
MPKVIRLNKGFEACADCMFYYGEPQMCNNCNDGSNFVPDDESEEDSEQCLTVELLAA